ncbi:MAG: response regulator PleD [Methanoregula sp. PtaU1.Bin051]|nr:MAG: response regulator PleD [Methanoregula sp. PtaU1.Bin051]
MNETIMIVDDSPYIVDGLVTLLKRKGYKPIAAHDGNECLTLLSSSRPDLILLDIMMEPVDGWEALEQIRRNPETSDIPILMFSAKKITPEEAFEHSMCIDDFVSKPVNTAELLGAIERVFERRKALVREMLRAQDAGLDAETLREYYTLLRNINVDKNLLSVLISSSGMDVLGKTVAESDRAAITKLKEKIQIAEVRLKEITNRFGENSPA